MSTNKLVPPRRTPMREITWQIQSLKPKAQNSISEFGFHAVRWLSFLVYVGGLQAEMCTRN